jgi:hypothetical protein
LRHRGYRDKDQPLGAGGSEGGFDIVALLVDCRIIPEQFPALGGDRRDCENRKEVTPVKPQ